MRESRLLGRAVHGEAVRVKLADPSERALIEALTQFYVYELTRIEPPCSNRLDGQDCYPAFAGIERYWRMDGFRPLLVRVCGRLAGFALINTHSRLGEKVEFNMADFFIAREYRGRGTATEAARLIMAQYPGRWEIAVAEHNAAARMFWSRTLAAVPNVSHVVRHEGCGQHWRGPIWSFRSDLKQPSNASNMFRDTTAAWH
jgi:predicted acetyltransferase